MFLCKNSYINIDTYRVSINFYVLKCIYISGQSNIRTAYNTHAYILTKQLLLIKLIVAKSLKKSLIIYCKYHVIYEFRVITNLLTIKIICIMMHIDLKAKFRSKRDFEKKDSLYLRLMVEPYKRVRLFNFSSPVPNLATILVLWYKVCV